MYLYFTKKEKGIQYRILFSRNKYCQLCESAVLMTIYIIAYGEINATTNFNFNNKKGTDNICPSCEISKLTFLKQLKILRV